MLQFETAINRMNKLLYIHRFLFVENQLESENKRTEQWHIVNIFLLQKAMPIVCIQFQIIHNCVMT